MKPEKNDTKQLPEGLSENVFQNWQDKHGDILHIVEAPLNSAETKFIGIVAKSPELDRKLCSLVEDKIDKNMDQAREILVKNCVLFNAEKVLENNIAFRAVSNYLFELFPAAKARVKN